jgi:hypothetical protein
VGKLRKKEWCLRLVLTGELGLLKQHQSTINLLVTVETRIGRILFLSAMPPGKDKLFCDNGPVWRSRGTQDAQKLFMAANTNITSAVAPFQGGNYG